LSALISVIPPHRCIRVFSSQTSISFVVPFVLLICHGGKQLRSAAFDAGCNDLLVNPISYYAFYRMLKLYLFPFVQTGAKQLSGDNYDFRGELPWRR
jgi:PleD family two-component response regulator